MCGRPDRAGWLALSRLRGSRCCGPGRCAKSKPRDLLRRLAAISCALLQHAELHPPRGVAALLTGADGSGGGRGRDEGVGTEPGCGARRAAAPRRRRLAGRGGPSHLGYSARARHVTRPSCLRARDSAAQRRSRSAAHGRSLTARRSSSAHRASPPLPQHLKPIMCVPSPRPPCAASLTRCVPQDEEEKK
jgi:hypothetical protein